MESIHLVCSPFESTIESNKLKKFSNDRPSISNEYSSYETSVGTSLLTNTNAKGEQSNASLSPNPPQSNTLEKAHVVKRNAIQSTTFISNLTQLPDRKTPLSSLSEHDSQINYHANMQIANCASTDHLAIESDQINDSCSIRMQGFSLDRQRQEMGITHHSNNVMETPTLTIAFSPFFTFSDDRSTIDVLTGEMPVELGRYEGGGCSILSGVEDQHNLKHPGEFIDIQGNLLSIATSPEKIKDQTADLGQDSTNLTYADNLLLNAAKFRKKSSSVVKKAVQKVSGKKRRAKNTNRPNRQPQKRYSVDLNEKDIPGGDMFGAKRDGQVRLTTNVPREVEALDPITNCRVYLFTSCSEEMYTPPPLLLK